METDCAGLEGLVLRYGSFYGPGTTFDKDGHVTKLVQKRSFPIIGNGSGIWSFVHVDDAAEATCLSLDHGYSGLYNIVDDEPAEVSVWLPEFAAILSAKPPIRIPRWLGRLAAGESGVCLMTEARGASNQKAKRDLNWQPAHRSWRSGFRLLH
nr:NAD(P)-dependent oxidoreductase [Acidobacterium sp. S8]